MIKISNQQYTLVPKVFGRFQGRYAGYVPDIQRISEVKSIDAKGQIDKWMKRSNFTVEEAEQAFSEAKNFQQQSSYALRAGQNVFEQTTDSVEKSMVLAWKFVLAHLEDREISNRSGPGGESSMLDRTAPAALSHILMHTPMNDLVSLFNNGWVHWERLTIKLLTSRPSWGYEECQQLFENVTGGDFWLNYRVASALFGESRYVVLDEASVDLLLKHGLLGVVYTETLEKFAVQVRGMSAGLTRFQYLNSLILGREWNNPIFNIENPRFDKRTFTLMFNCVMSQLTVDEEYYVQALHKAALKAEAENDFRATVLCETQPIYGLAVVLKILSEMDLSDIRTDKKVLPFSSSDGEFELLSNLESCLPAGLFKVYFVALLLEDLHILNEWDETISWLRTHFSVAFDELTPEYLKDLLEDDDFNSAWKQFHNKAMLVSPARKIRYQAWFKDYNSYRGYYFDGKLVKLLVEASVMDKFYLRELEAFWEETTGESVESLPADWVIKIASQVYNLGVLSGPNEDPDDYI